MRSEEHSDVAADSGCADCAFADGRLIRQLPHQMATAVQNFQRLVKELLKRIGLKDGEEDPAEEKSEDLRATWCTFP